MRRRRPTPAPPLTPRGLLIMAVVAVASAGAVYGLFCLSSAITHWIVHREWRL